MSDGREEKVRNSNRCRTITIMCKVHGSVSLIGMDLPLRSDGISFVRSFVRYNIVAIAPPLWLVGLPLDRAFL